jgi:transposase
MAIVAGFDVHRAQITFDALDDETGELSRGRITADPDAVRSWVERFEGREIHVAVEACTGWLFVCEALVEAGATAHLAEPVETSARRGKKRRAKTDREDARWLRQLLAEGRLPEAWIPPAHVREWRTRTRLRKTLIDERTAWLQRVQATLFHHGVGGVPAELRSAAGREFLARLELPAAALERIEVALALVDALDRQLGPIESELRRLARRQPGCRALQRHFGIGELTAPMILCELGDVARLSASRQAVRCAGLDIGVHRSDRRSRVGKLTRQGSPQLRWALFEAAQSACRSQSPDHADYLALKARGLSHVRASMTIARKLARRSFHTLRELGPAALETRQLTRHRRPLPPRPPIEDDTKPSGQLPQRLRFPPPGGGPPKTERPESSPAERPINHHVAGHQAVDLDKAGRPRSDRS